MTDSRTHFAIDIGSSSIKAAVVAVEDGTWLSTRRWPTPAPHPDRPLGRHETHAQSIVAAVSDSIDEVCDRFPGVSAIGFSTQMHGVVLTDQQNRAISPFISWQDDRANERFSGGGSLLEDVRQQVPAAVLARTGINPRAGLGAFNARRWLDENPARAGDVRRVHTLGSFILASLAGVYTTHLTNAAALGVVDISLGRWDAELIEWLGLDGLQFPEIRSDFTSVSSVTRSTGHVAIFPDVGDHQASVYGSERDDADSISISLGTAGIAARTAAEFVPSSRYEVRPYLDGRYLQTISRLPGGRHFDACTALFGTVGRDVFGIENAKGRAREWLFDSFQGGSPVVGAAVTAFEDPNDDGAARLGISLPLGAEVDPSDVLNAVLGHFGVRYRQAAADLFDGRGPARGSLNGGLALSKKWLPDFFATELSAQFAVTEGNDLALQGVLRLLREGS
ncbi:MAG TPA: FGGY family carbohydrate kinase [Beutenbergiaceae bacterium]|nr:FGGY family carbohydrate kinase [Beutenbergiaceae bacterium]